MDFGDIKKGDLVKADGWISRHVGGDIGVVVKVQDGSTCVGAYILFAVGGVKLIRIENLKEING